MFAKLLLVILASALTAACLLVIRQHRLELAHEASRIHLRLSAHERSLWTLQDQVARRCRPEDVRLALEQSRHEWIRIPSWPAQVELRVTDAAQPRGIDLGG